MNQLRIYIFIIIINFCFAAQAQNDTIVSLSGAPETVKIITDSIPKQKEGKVFLSFDLFNPAMALFSDKKAYEGMITYHIKKKWHAVAEIGHDQNEYKKSDWEVDAKGTYFKLGFNWFIIKDVENPSNGFYTGLRFAYSSYKQHIKQYPIRNSDNSISEYGSLPEKSVSAYWMELVGGGRVQIFKNLYADVSLRPQIFLGAKEQEGIDPLVVPGYGKDYGSINFTLFWGITYKLF